MCLLFTDWKMLQYCGRDAPAACLPESSSAEYKTSRERERKRGREIRLIERGWADDLNRSIHARHRQQRSRGLRRGRSARSRLTGAGQARPGRSRSLGDRGSQRSLHSASVLSGLSGAVVRRRWTLERTTISAMTSAQADDSVSAEDPAACTNCCTASPTATLRSVCYARCRTLLPSTV